MRFIATALLIFLACFGMLHIVYPWSTSYGVFAFGWWTAMNAYMLVAAIVGIAAAIFNMLMGRKKQSPLLHGAMCGLSLMGFAVILAIVFGPLGVNIPGTRVRGIFFSEWEFINFVFCVSIPVAIVVAGFSGLMIQKYPPLRKVRK